MALLQILLKRFFRSTFRSFLLFFFLFFFFVFLSLNQMKTETVKCCTRSNNKYFSWLYTIFHSCNLQRTKKKKKKKIPVSAKSFLDSDRSYSMSKHSPRSRVALFQVNNQNLCFTFSSDIKRRNGLLVPRRPVGRYRPIKARTTTNARLQFEQIYSHKVQKPSM